MNEEEIKNIVDNSFETINSMYFVLQNTSTTALFDFNVFYYYE